MIQRSYKENTESNNHLIRVEWYRTNTKQKHRHIHTHNLVLSEVDD